MTQGALAAAAHVHINELVEWEAGRRVPQVPTVASLARALGRSPQDLLDNDKAGQTTLQQLRVAAGLSQQQAAVGSGLLRTTYSKIERGETATLSEDDTRAIARALGARPPQVRAAHQAAVRGRSTDRGPRRQGKPAIFD